MLRLMLPPADGSSTEGHQQTAVSGRRRQALEAGGELHRELIELRRDLHAHPELGFQEHRTAEVVARSLRASGLEVAEGIGGTGVVATIRGAHPGNRAIGLRADMDAISVSEQTGLPYASRTAGVMHACGHDGHTTVLLGAARQLAEDPDFAGTVHMIFQPAEEGLGGAPAMIRDGLFERFPCDAVYALHTAPGIPIGSIVTSAGPMMAAAGTFDVSFSGRGGHGGQGAHLTADLTVVQANYVMALQTVVARDLPAVESAVISVGYVSGGSAEAPNVMPSMVSLKGTVRCFSEDTQALVSRRIEQLAESLATAYGATASAQVVWITPPLINRPEQAEIVARAAAAAVGGQHVITSMPPITGGEDFGFMLETTPGAFLLLGNGTGPDGEVHNVHTPTFDFNDDAIPSGVALWTTLIDLQLGLA
jgi:amidohydrolase